MAAPRRVTLAAVLALAIGGCTQPWMTEDWPDSPTPTATTPAASADPSPTPTPSTAAPTTDPVREQFPYQGTLAEEGCEAISRGLLDDLEAVGGQGEAVSYTRGAMVKADGPWSTIAVATRVNANEEGVTRGSVDDVLWFVTNGPSVTPGDPVSTWPLRPDPDDDAADRALICLARVPTPPPEPPEDSPASYTGRLASGATCRAVDADVLKHLQDVGRVGGAITYSRGQMIRANKKWWTIAVATEVHPNKLGYTRANVPETVFFVTNAPSMVDKPVYFTLDDPGEEDTAAPAALRCLRG